MLHIKFKPSTLFYSYVIIQKGFGFIGKYLFSLSL